MTIVVIQSYLRVVSNHFSIITSWIQESTRVGTHTYTDANARVCSLGVRSTLVMWLDAMEVEQDVGVAGDVPGERG